MRCSKVLPGTGRGTTKWWRGLRAGLRPPSVSASRCHLPFRGGFDVELTSLTIAELRDGFRGGEFSAREIAEAYNAAVAAAKPLNAYTVETPDDALAAADAADKARGSAASLGSLAGIPLGIKDLFATEGVDTTAGSRILKGFKPPYESTVTANLRKAGAGMLGKLNMDEFAMGSSNETSAYGPVISPWRRKGSNVGLTPGGSSGGSAAAVAAHIAPGATGTDTGGSIRQPAAFAGICGIKPTYGRCSRWGIVAFASSLDQAGPMAQDGARLRDPARGDGRVRSEGFDLARPAGAAVGSESVERSQGQARRHSQGISDRRRARRHQRAVGPGHRMAEGRGRDAGRDQPAAHQICAADLLHHRARRGVVQPRPL